MKNRIAAALAVMAMSGFLTMFGVLIFAVVPSENKDFFNMGFIALINFVGTAFGYYLGSSLGSARKNDLLAQGGPGVVSAGNEAGFARFEFMAAMVAIGALFLIAGCATMKAESPQVTAGKALLATKSAIVTAATSADSLCRSGQMSPERCARAKEAYEMAKPAYDSAVDAYLLMVTGGDPTQVDASMQRLRDITNNLVLLNGGAK